MDINFETPSTDTTFVKIEEISFDMEEEATIEHIVGQNEGCSYMLEKLKTIIV